jgi:hypothetical protein
VWWYAFVIPATQEVEIGRILSKASLDKKRETLSKKITKKGLGLGLSARALAWQEQGPEFKLQFCKKKAILFLT